MRNLQTRIPRLEKDCPSDGATLAAAKAFARTALEIKTGHAITDGPLLDRVAVWGARHGLSVRAHLDEMARVDRLASYLGGNDTAVPGSGECTDIHEKTADELLAMLDNGVVDVSDLLTLHGLRAA